MAECIRYLCNHCSKELQSWSDGNPYFINDSGGKEYAYHPDHEGLARCIGNDSPYLCLRCGHGFRVDSRSPSPAARRAEQQPSDPPLSWRGCRARFASRARSCWIWASAASPRQRP